MNYFSDKELACPCCGENKFNPNTKRKLNALRAELGKPITVVSGYRCEAYNRKNGYTQTHATGQAVDVDFQGVDAIEFMALAWKHGFTGFGIDDKGKLRIRHIDDLQPGQAPRPALWRY